MNGELDIYEENRPWGSFRRFTNNVSSTVKIITVLPNEQLSLQSHQKRSEFWRVLKGGGYFEIDGNKHEVSIGDEYNVAIGAKHRIFSGAEGLEILEIGLGEFDEEDIVRYEDKYGRS